MLNLFDEKPYFSNFKMQKYTKLITIQMNLKPAICSFCLFFNDLLKTIFKEKELKKKGY